MLLKKGPGLGPWARSRAGPGPARTSYLHRSTRLAWVYKTSEGLQVERGSTSLAWVCQKWSEDKQNKHNSGENIYALSSTSSLPRNRTSPPRTPWSYLIVTGHNQFVHRHCHIISGQYKVLTRRCQIVTGHNQIVTGQYQIVTSHNQVVTGHQQIEIGQYQLGMGQHQEVAGVTQA